MQAMQELSGSQNGFGGDLRFGQATGLAGADEICRTIAERSLAGSSVKQWRAFLSASKGALDGGPVNAIDRIGPGPWYDRLGRLVANDRAGLLAGPRPNGTQQVGMDLPNESGEGNHQDDNHDTLTGSDKQGLLSGSTCSDWTSKSGTGPSCGHSWPRSSSNLNSGGHWLSDHKVPGCAAGISLDPSNGGGAGSNTVGGAGGYGGIYCFALTP